MFPLFIFILQLLIHCTFLPAQEFQPPILVFENKAAMGKACAERMVQLIIQNNLLEKPTVLGLATGSTPLPVYEAFIQLAQEQQLNLSRVITFNLDEYTNLPQEHEQSYHRYMYSHFFQNLLQSSENPFGIPLQNIFIPNGTANIEEDLSDLELEILSLQFPERLPGDPLSQEEALFILQQRTYDYEALIQQLGPIDIQILGIGTNGHIGFAEPGSSFVGKTMLVQLTENTRKDNARFFSDHFEEVPTHAMTMGIGTILKAKEIYLLASGTAKGFHY